MLMFLFFQTYFKKLRNSFNKEMLFISSRNGENKIIKRLINERKCVHSNSFKKKSFFFQYISAYKDKILRKRQVFLTYCKSSLVKYFYHKYNKYNNNFRKYGKSR